MNDQQIRISFHHKCLSNRHKDSATLVIDELGLQHGKCRADIAVLNGHFIGYEIKSDTDSLRRLNNQITIYNSVFDRLFAVVAPCHLNEAMTLLPDWWGVILVSEGKRGAIYFKTARHSKQNRYVDDYAVAQLLWRDEAQEILTNLGIRGKVLREKRANLYTHISKKLDSSELRKTVKKYLMNRANWRRPLQLLSRDDLSQSISM
ncbi:MAG: sce7726 family protein [bacterium]